MEGAPAPEAVSAHITNSSAQPIYDVTISWHKGTAPWDEPDRINVLMPGTHDDFIHDLPTDLPPSVDRSLFASVARFRDAAGVRWLLTPDGELREELLPE